MDSVTQIALGAAVGEATLGRKVGYRALMWGGVCGTLPDLDIFVPLGNAVSDFTYHRSASHSLIMLAATTPLVAWFIVRIHQHTSEYFKRWCLLVYLVFATHALLDSFTAYGTQIFWPISNSPVAWSTIFIIDPLYTMPLLVGTIAALVMTRDRDRGHMINSAGLTISTLYLGWTVVAKAHVAQTVLESLESQTIAYEKVFTTPAPFNSLLWRAVVMHETGYYEGYYSILDEDEHIEFTSYDSDESLLQGIGDYWPVQRLKWFSKGFYAVDREQDAVVISDLRMGVASSYVFRFKVGEISNPHATPAKPVRLTAVRDMDRLRWLWRRVWTEVI